MDDYRLVSIMHVPIVEARNVSKSFSGVQALQDVSLTLREGEICCLVGENGSGKSTLIKVIAGVVTPDNGDLVLGGNPYKQLRPIDSIRAGIQVIYQDFSLFPNLTVAENIALSHQVARDSRFVNWSEVYSIARDVAERMEFQVDVRRPVGDLPVADRQLTAIARALLQDARLIIMDEPTTALTQREVGSLFRVIRNLQEQGIAVLFVSHKLDEVLEIADRIIILRNGKKVADGDVSDFDNTKLIYHMTGKHISDDQRMKPVEKHHEREVLLEVRDLGRTGEFSDVSFSLSSGDILGITGLLGSGRTELAMSLFGMKPADRGEILVGGKQVEIHSVQDAMNNGIGYVPEDRLTEGLFFKQSVAKNITISAIDELTSRLNFIDSKKAENEAAKWIEALQIVTPSGAVPVQTLSGGNQQKVVLGKWLATSPHILILNSPTVGVDVGAKAAIHDLIKELAFQGIGVIVISDDIPELVQNCHRVLLMKSGQIAQEFSGSDMTESALASGLVGTAETRSGANV